MDFQLTEEQLMLQKTARDFARKEVRPVAIELDKKTNPAECISWDLVRKASKLGFRTASFPKEYGGMGLGWLDQTVLTQELAYGDVGFGFTNYHVLLFGVEIPHMRKEVKDEFVPKIIKDDTFLLATGMTEPDPGATERIMGYDEPMGGARTFAEKKGNEYVINGTKQFISNGPVCKAILVWARTSKGPMSTSISSFFVPTDTPGFSVTRVNDFLGCRLLLNGELSFDNMRIPARYLMGQENNAYEQMVKRAPQVLLLKNANLLACARAGYDEAVNYTKTRVVCGKPIIDHPTIRFMLGEVRSRIDAAQLLIYKCAWNLDHFPENVKDNREICYLTKGFINDLCSLVIRNCDEVFGGYGSIKGMPLEKYVRDMQTLQHAYTNRHIAYMLGAPTRE